MSVTIGTIAGTTGLGSERQVVALAGGDLWAFAYSGTLTLSTWYSQDGGQTWNSGNSLTLANVHNGEGRNLAVAYKPVGGVDVVHIAMLYKAITSLGAIAIRASISGTTITFHTTATSVATPTSDSDSLFWGGIGMELDTNNKVHFASGWSGGGNGDINSSDSTADPGGAEQQTAVTWTSHVIDSSILKEVRSFYVVDLGGGSVGLLADDGSAASTLTGVSYYEWNGTAWNTNDTNQLATGAITAIGKNNWGCVTTSPTDVHVVYRNSSGTLLHRRFDGSTWFNGQTIPAQTNLDGGGIALTSDGACVWLSVIDTDSNNTLRTIRWTPLSHNGVVDQWDSVWSATETSSATRTLLGCARDVVNEVGLLYWTEGTSMVAAPFVAISPPDPAGAFVQIAQGSTGVAGTTFAVTFTTSNVVSGNRIIVAIAIWNSTATTVTSVTDSAGNTYVKDRDAVESDGTHISIWSAPITVGGGTKPTVTAHASASTAEWAMYIEEWAGLKAGNSGYTDGTNAKVIGISTSPVTSNASTPVPATSGEIAIGFYGDGGNGVVTIGVSAGWTQRGSSIQNTSSTAEACIEDQNTTAGVGSNASFTITNTGSPAGALVVVYQLAAASGGYNRQTFPTISGLQP